jgi:plastocyanin
MRFTLASATLAAIAAATSASAANFQVQVGNGGLMFTPPSVNASVGDTVSFVFYPKNHTVTQSSFPAPCQPLSGGIDSGFQPVAANATQVPSFSVTVNATTPLWFFCHQTGHCESGMVFAINPTANKSFDAFQATANASSSTGAPPSSNSSGTTTPSPSGTGSSSSTTSTTSSKSNSALSSGAQAGGILAAVGLAAGILL